MTTSALKKRSRTMLKLYAYMIAGACICGAITVLIAPADTTPVMGALYGGLSSNIGLALGGLLFIVTHK